MLTAKDLSDGKEPMSHAEIDYLHELARNLPPEPQIVNIGADQGLSTLSFLEACPDAFIFSVDILPCQQEFDHIKQGWHSTQQVVRLLGDSKEFGKTFPTKCDLLFIDGDHWGAGKDLEIWMDKVKPGGIIALHDYIVPPNPPNNPGDVYNQTNEWHRQHPEYEVVGWIDRIIAFRVPTC